MDCVYSYWTTDRADGFTDDELGALKRLTPFLGLAIKAASLARIAETLVETYLGRDAGRRVLRGRIERGVADRINTVLWFSDLRNYTRISDTSPPEADHSAAQRLCRGHRLVDPPAFRRRLEADRRWRACDLSCRGTKSRLRGRARRRRRRARGGRRLERAPVRKRLALDRNVSRPPFRRGLLRQHRQQGAPGLHRRRTGGQRGEPHRRHVPVGGSADPSLVGVRGILLRASA